MYNKRFYLECGNYGNDWQNWPIDIESPDQFYNLDFFIKTAFDQETHGKYHFRVVDIEGHVYCHWRDPYEGVRIDPISQNEWLEAIRKDYKLNTEIFRTACKQWLENHEEKT